jgi:hypothetical protein
LYIFNENSKLVFSLPMQIFSLLGNKAANSRVKTFVALPIEVTHPLLLLRIAIVETESGRAVQGMAKAFEG